jgi:hypothetical protein
MANEPGDLVLATFASIIDRVKSTRPIQSNGKGLTVGVVYSPLVLGLMVDPHDYVNPWSPSAGTTLAEAVATDQAAAATGTPAPNLPADPGAPPTGLTPQQRAQLAIRAAFNTSQLIDRMLMVTTDDSYQEYPTERKISFAYEGIIKGMQPAAVPDVTPEIQKRIDAAKKVLYEVDEDGNIVGKSKLFERYRQAAENYAQAKADFDEAQLAARSDPALASAFVTGKGPLLQRKVTDAFQDWKTLGAEKVEAALATLGSVGINIDAAMVAKAREVWEAWQVSVSGVPVTTPYASIMPTAWCDPNAKDIGWQSLTVTQESARSIASSASAQAYHRQWQKKTSSTGGGGAVSIFGFGAAAQGGSRNSSVEWGDGSNSWSQSSFRNDAQGMEISLEYGLCTIDRPWFIGDLFYLRNWYLVGQKANAISSGDIPGQALDQNKLLPMVPRQFLCVRNVKIKATKWNSDGETLRSAYREAQGATNSQGTYVSGGAGFSIGFLSVGATASHSSSTDTSSASGSSGTRTSSNYGWSFDGETLEIKGTQIIAWLSEIAPPCAPLDDPSLA